MIGKHRDGGYAEYVAVPARSLVPLPEGISFEHGAIMMCSSATSFHAMRKARLTAGERVAIFGVGGLGMSALQLAKAFGAMEVYAVDIHPDRLALAEKLGAIPVDARENDPVTELMCRTNGQGVDVALELIGLPLTMRQAVQCLAVLGRAVLVGISAEPFEVHSYTELLGKEAEIIGSSDHLLSELPTLLEFARRGVLDLSTVVTSTIPLKAAPINAALDGLARFGEGIRTVIVP
jgi:propanol-preferring alcohol dehydrogenase